MPGWQKTLNESPESPTPRRSTAERGRTGVTGTVGSGVGADVGGAREGVAVVVAVGVGVPVKTGAAQAASAATRRSATQARIFLGTIGATSLWRNRGLRLHYIHLPFALVP
jgi:hypothetical protein